MKFVLATLMVLTLASSAFAASKTEGKGITLPPGEKKAVNVIIKQYKNLTPEEKQQALEKLKKEETQVEKRLEREKELNFYKH
jgi:hypothetical protein